MMRMVTIRTRLMTLDDLFEQFTSNDVEDGDDDGDDDNYNAFDGTPR